MMAVDVFDGCLTELFSEFRITDSAVNRTRGKSILLSYFGGQDGIAERTQELDKVAAGLTAREQELDARIKNGMADLNKSRAQLQSENDAHIKAGIKAGLDAQAASLSKQSQELEQQTKALTQKQAELDRLQSNVTAEVNKAKAALQKEYDDRMAIQDCQGRCIDEPVENWPPQ
jgi:uncharacterized protein involved in exopolysaccharide biosynthesis